MAEMCADVPPDTRLQISDAPSMHGAATAWTASESGTPSLNATRTGQVCVCLQGTVHSIVCITGQAGMRLLAATWQCGKCAEGTQPAARVPCDGDKKMLVLAGHG